jgi:hypothetical protein
LFTLPCDATDERVVIDQRLGYITRNDGIIIGYGIGNTINNHYHSASASRGSLLQEQIFLTDPDIDREHVKGMQGERVPSTCEWILEHEMYKAWRDVDGHPFSWISGGPGKGKTMMSLFLTENLEKGDNEVIFSSAIIKMRNRIPLPASYDA